MTDPIRERAMEIIATEAEEMGYSQEDVADYLTEEWYDGDDMLLLQAVERALNEGMSRG